MRQILGSGQASGWSVQTFADQALVTYVSEESGFDSTGSSLEDGPSQFWNARAS